MTVHLMVTIVGENMSTAFIMKGESIKAAYTDTFLVEHRCDPESTITMTGNTYMTDEAWVGITKSIVHGYWQTPLIR